MAEILNLDKVRMALLTRARKFGDGNQIVRVGYTANYALRLHEDLEARGMGRDRPSGLGQYWGPSFYGPKFLEGPAREFAADIRMIVFEALRKGASFIHALLLGGLRLQRESQLRVPVEHGILKASAFTRAETA